MYLSLLTAPYMLQNLRFTNITTTSSLLFTVYIYYITSPQSKPQLLSSSSAAPCTHSMAHHRYVRTGQSLCPPHPYHKSLINASVNSHETIEAKHTHTYKQSTILCTCYVDREAQIILATPIAYTPIKIPTSCHTQHSLYTHRHKPMPESATQTQQHAHDAMSQCHVSATPHL